MAVARMISACSSSRYVPRSTHAAYNVMGDLPVLETSMKIILIRAPKPIAYVVRRILKI
jgi:hypothetical protein